MVASQPSCSLLETAVNKADVCMRVFEAVVVSLQDYCYALQPLYTLQPQRLTPATNGPAKGPTGKFACL